MKSITIFGLPIFSSSLAFEKVCGELRKYPGSQVDQMKQMVSSHNMRNSLKRCYTDNVQGISFNQKNSYQISFDNNDSKKLG